MRSTGMHKPPVPPKPTLVQQHQRSGFSPGSPRREGLLLPSPGTPRRTKPQLAPKPCLSKLNASPESKAFAPRSQIHQRADLSNSQGDVQQENNRKPNWDYIIPICLCSKENCTCVKNTNKLEKVSKGGSSRVAVANGGERITTNGHVANHRGLQQTPTADRNFNSGKSPVRPHVPHRTWSDEANGNLVVQGELGEGVEEEEEKQKCRRKPVPVPLPRKPRTAVLTRQEKVEEDGEEIRSRESRDAHINEVKVPVEGKSNSSPAGGRDPPPRKRLFLLTPQRAPTSAAPQSLLKDEEEQEEELGWDSSSHEMDVSLDKEEEEEKQTEQHQEAVYADFTSCLVETAELCRPCPEDLEVKATPKKPQRKRSPMAAWRQRSDEKPSEPPRLPEKPSRFLAAATAVKPRRPSLGKQRAKSFSSADLVRSEGQRRSSFRRLLDLKLTVKMLPKLVVKGSPGSGEQSVDGPPLRLSEQINLRRELPRPLIGVEQSVDGDDGPPGDDTDIYYENVPYYEEIADYINVDVGSARSPSLLQSVPAWPSSGWSGLMYDDEGIYEEQEPYMSFQKPAEQQQQLQQQLAEHDREGREDSVDKEVAHPDNSLSDGTILTSSSDEEEEEEEDDSSSLSSKGEGERPEESLKQSEQQKKKSKIQHIATEIMSSESVFVDVLKLLHVDFRGAASAASRQNGKPVIEERLLNQILYYLPQLYELNQDLLRELKQRVAKWDEKAQLADIFLKKGPYLKMYSTYIREFDKNVALLEEQSKKNPAFGAVVREFEASPLCANLALKHYLLKPVQRIPQYQLLLTDYLKNLSQDSADYKDTQDALAIVKEVANHANDIMKQGDNFQKLIQVQCRLIGNHEIVQPGRVFLKEGVLKKLSRKVMQPRMFFLFSDSLLYTTPAQSGQFKVKNMFSLAGMKVSKPSQEAYQNELNIESVERSFTLSASSASERDEWLEAITTAIGDYTRKKITFVSGKSQDEKELWADGDGAPLGSKAPIWIPDLRATMCMICTCEFTLAWRRHHCRACGKVVCKSCSSNKCQLEYRKNELLRVCDQCYLTLQQQKSEMVPSTATSPGHRATFAFHRKQKKKIPAALKEVSANTDSSMSGYLYKSKCDKKQGKRQWFVIKDKVLYTYAASEDVAALKSQPLLGFELRAESPQSLQFKLYHKKTLYFVFKADDVQTAQRWIDSFKEATVL